ncbi:MAG: four helix bundle protein [Saprospiraceae bacterium]|nr:four helix bundle protein [Saprospiraceae bacterium]
MFTLAENYNNYEGNEILKLNDIEAYKIAFHLSNYIWEIVIKWDFFAKQTIGAQFVDAGDSMSSNIAEGFGRWGKKDKIKFYRYSQGSRKECYDWNEKSRVRKLVTEDEYNHIFQELEKLGPAIGRLIKFTNEKLSE